MEVDLDIQKGLTGTFKTAHHGKIIFHATAIPTCFGEKVCVKHPYQQKSTGAIARYRESEEYEMVVKELVCLDWATILLDLTYGFIAEAVLEHGDPPREVPKLRFVRAMLTEAPTLKNSTKHFLVEEWVGSTKAFTKYINNGRPVSCVRPDAPKEDHQIAEFLCFAQHVQYNQTGGLAFTSDYQGLLIHIQPVGF